MAVFLSQSLTSHPIEQQRQFLLQYLSTPTPTPSYGGEIESHSSGKMNRPKTAAAVLARNECDRLFQVEREPTRRHCFESHLPNKKVKPPPWQRNLDPPLVPFVVGPGYILSKSKTKYAVTLKDNFFDPIEEEPEKRKQVESERDALIARLQQQISDLSLFLEEERLNHRHTKQKFEGILKDKQEELEMSHKSHIKVIDQEHEEAIDKLQKRLSSEHSNYQSGAEAQIGRLKKDIEFLQGAFESYKSSLHLETQERCGLRKKREADLEIQLEEAKQQAVHELKTKLIQEKNADKMNIGRDHQKNIEALRKEHKKELDTLLRRFSHAATDIEKLKNVTAELEETKSELSAVKTRYDETCQQLANTTRSLADNKVRLISFEQQFEAKVQEVDDRYKYKIQDLMTENTELRRLYLKKCAELFDEKANTELLQSVRVSSAQSVMKEMIESKHRANVSLRPSDLVLDKKDRKRKDRPGSAPQTKEEVASAHVSAGETDHLFEACEDDFSVTPNIDLEKVNEEVESIRQKLMADVKVMTQDDLSSKLSDL
ncbi:hypothetical protein ScPMuIL_013837 [Solemya velum]